MARVWTKTTTGSMTRYVASDGTIVTFTTTAPGTVDIRTQAPFSALGSVGLDGNPITTQALLIANFVAMMRNNGDTIT